MWKAQSKDVEVNTREKHGGRLYSPSTRSNDVNGTYQDYSGVNWTTVTMQKVGQLSHVSVHSAVHTVQIDAKGAS